MSDEALIPVTEIPGQVQKWNEKSFTDLVTATGYLPRLQLQTANSKPCKAGTFPVNHYAIVKDKTLRDIGLTVDVLIIAWRPKALEMGEAVIAAYDPEDAEFKRIAEKSEIKDSGCMYGPEFLVWVPALSQFALFYMGNKSARRESPNMVARLYKGATLKSKHIETKQYDWYAPCVTPCTTPFEVPSKEDIAEQVEKFNNPPKTEVETATEEDETKERPR